MTVGVRIIAPDSGNVTALVTATSRERFKCRPIARIETTRALPVLPGENPGDTRERVRDEALRFLDVE